MLVPQPSNPKSINTRCTAAFGTNNQTVQVARSRKLGKTPWERYRKSGKTYFPDFRVENRPGEGSYGTRQWDKSLSLMIFPVFIKLSQILEAFPDFRSFPRFWAFLPEFRDIARISSLNFISCIKRCFKTLRTGESSSESQLKLFNLREFLTQGNFGELVRNCPVFAIYHSQVLFWVLSRTELMSHRVNVSLLM